MPVAGEPSIAHPRKGHSATSLSMRISPQDLSLIDEAAVAMGKTRTEFVLDCARRHATEVLLDQRLFVLDDARHDAFMAALDNPPKPSARLKRLMKDPAPWETR